METNLYKCKLHSTMCSDVKHIFDKVFFFFFGNFLIESTQFMLKILTIFPVSSILGIGLADEDPHKQTNLEDIQTLTKSSRITTLNFGNTEDEILLGRVEPVVKVYEPTLNAITGSHSFEHGPVVGLAKFNGKIIAGLGNGKIQIGHKKMTFLETGDAMSRLRQCATERKLIASGGKERQNNLKVWNLESNQCVFRTKNIPNDFLQLEVPIWDNDFAFIDANCLSTCSRYGYVRVYDMRKQRRPIFNYTNDKEQISYSCLTVHGDVVFCGTTTGVMHAFDLRKMKHVLHTYKGFAGSISDIGIDESGKFVYSASLDRFVRVHHSESTILQYQCYVKSKATRILLRQYTPVKVKEESNKPTKKSTSNVDSNKDEDDDDDDDFDEMFNKMPTVV